jgi:hypothetical protein
MTGEGGIAMNMRKSMLSIAAQAAPILIVALVVLRVHAQTPPSYPLTCRGGGGSSFDFSIGASGGLPSALTVHFRGASVGAATRPPQAGECAWLDRGWRTGEPELLQWGGRPDYVRLSFAADGRLGSIRLPSPAGADATDFRYLLDALRTGRTFQVRAYSGGLFGARFLVITHVGP